LATILIPLAGALLIGIGAPGQRWVALASALAAFIASVLLIAQFPGGDESYARVAAPWLGGPGTGTEIRAGLALDGLSLWFFGLTTLLMVVAVLVSWRAISQRLAAYYSLLLLLESAMLGVFAARDIILFYVCFEFTLLPLFFLIGVWGSEERRHAAIKFFIFTFTGSMLTLLGLLAIVLWNSHQPNGTLTFSIDALSESLALRPLSLTAQTWIFLALFAGFAVKVPLFPLHTWLPLAHVQAPTAGSVLLAGVLLKVGSYGFLRFCLPMVPGAVAAMMPWLLWLSVIGILYGALVALVQDDMKRLVAYSSVSHLGFCMLGVFALDPLGAQGGTLQMINHGLSTGGLFALVGMIYERYHTRKIADLGGLAKRTPVLAFFFLLLALSSIGLPGLNGFAGEFTLLLGMFHRAWGDPPAAWAVQLRVISVLATLGVVLGAWYMLWLVQRIFFGPLKEPPARSAEDDHAQEPVRDLSLREVSALASLCVFILWIGLWPDFFFSRLAPKVNAISQPPTAALAGQWGTGVGGWGTGVGGRGLGVGEQGMRLDRDVRDDSMTMAGSNAAKLRSVIRDPQPVKAVDISPTRKRGPETSGLSRPFPSLALRASCGDARRVVMSTQRANRSLGRERKERLARRAGETGAQRHRPQGVALGWKNGRPFGAGMERELGTAIPNQNGAFLPAQAQRATPVAHRREIASQAPTPEPQSRPGPVPNSVSGGRPKGTVPRPPDPQPPSALPPPTGTLTLLTPEIVLIAVAVAIFMLGALWPSEGIWPWVALGGLIVAAVALAGQSPGSVGRPLVADNLAFYVRWLDAAEYVGLLLLTVAGMMLVAVANELVLIFVGLELVSIPTYILLYLGRNDLASQESATKYFFLSVLASAILLYGFSFLYGTTGSTDLAAIHRRLAGAGAAGGGLLSLAKLALVMIFAGLGFRITAVPFHFYAPDVYQGTTQANAGFLSVVPKIAGFMVLVRLVAVAMAGIGPYPWRIALVLAILTMTLGNFVALWQDNVRRLLAYSSIAQAGYMLIGLAACLAAAPGNAAAGNGASALMLYLLVYAVATLGAFAALDCLSGEGDRRLAYAVAEGRTPTAARSGQKVPVSVFRANRQIDGIDDLAGLAWTAGWVRRFLAWALALFLFSLAGIPPLAGFWGKLAVILSALNTGAGDASTQGWFIALAVIGVLNAAVSAGYYLRVVGVIFFRTPLATPRTREEPGLSLLATALCVLLVLAIGIMPRSWSGPELPADPAKSKAEFSTRQSAPPTAQPHQFRVTSSLPL
jgi:NADH-quinone oxidoreductase subunit M